jgi:hypothetical protein
LCAFWRLKLLEYLLRMFRQKLGDNRMKSISKGRTVVEARTAAGNRPLNISTVQTTDRACPKAAFSAEAWCRYEHGGYPGEKEAVRGPGVLSSLHSYVDKMNKEANGEKVGKIEGDSDLV